MAWQFCGGEFLLRAIGDHYFHYRRGEGIVIDRPANVDSNDDPLWLNGSVYSAVASLNGLVPIHASAVLANGSVFAFSGPPGAGKSTLVAALGDRGLPLFCDDTLVLDLGDPERILCLPGHKRLKLTSYSFRLTGAAQQEKVSDKLDKFYASSAAGNVGSVAPLAELIFLDLAPDPSIVPISGFERFAKVQDDHYTFHLYAAAQGFDESSHFEHLARLATGVAMSRFARPIDADRFNECTEFVADYVLRGGAASLAT